MGFFLRCFKTLSSGFLELGAVGGRKSLFVFFFLTFHPKVPVHLKVWMFSLLQEEDTRSSYQLSLRKNPPFVHNCMGCVIFSHFSSFEAV